MKTWITIGGVVYCLLQLDAIWSFEQPRWGIFIAILNICVVGVLYLGLYNLWDKYEKLLKKTNQNESTLDRLERNSRLTKKDCPRCGKSIDSDYSSCPHCGNSFER